MLTDTLMEVFAQCITIPTLTLIATNLVAADVVTTAIIDPTLINVYGNNNNTCSNYYQ